MESVCREKQAWSRHLLLLVRPSSGQRRAGAKSLPGGRNKSLGSFLSTSGREEINFGGDIFALNPEASVKSACANLTPWVFYSCALTCRRVGARPHREAPDGALSVSAVRAFSEWLQLKTNRKSMGSPAYVQTRTHAALATSRRQPVKCAGGRFCFPRSYLCVMKGATCWGSLLEYYSQRAKPLS